MQSWLTKAVVCGVFLMAGSSAFASLNLDFNDGGSPTQAGFEGVTLAGATGLNGGAVGSSIGVSFTTDGGELDARNRSIVPGSLANLGRDFIFAVRGGTPPATYMDIVISGIDAGLYEFTGYFHDSDPASGASNALMDVLYSVDGGTTFFTGLDDFARSEGTDPVAAGSFQFAATGDDVVIRVNASVNGHLINGLQIAAVPEAGTLAIWSVLSLGGIAAVSWSRRASKAAA